jgi:AraC-like DNA-binding protein
MVGASPSRLAQIFREYTGTTVRQALLRRRLTETKRLLATSDMSVTELLHISGFNDVSYFNRTFRADTGVTPREYRRRALGTRSEPGD